MGYRGVYADEQRKKFARFKKVQAGVWSALFAIRGHKKHLGSFYTERQAVVAYDNYSEVYRGTRPNGTDRLETSDPFVFLGFCTECGKWKLRSEFTARPGLRLGAGKFCELCRKIVQSEAKRVWESKLNDDEKSALSRKRKAWSKVHYAKPDVKLKSLLRSSINAKLQAKSLKKQETTLELTGCTIKFLRTHLERQFQPGMTWENRGAWHIDHVRPCALFDLSDLTQRRTCFHWSNLQPLWARDNLAKGARY